MAIANFWRRFGAYSSIVLFFGSGLLLICVAFLAFIWAGDEQRPLWRRLVEKAWLSRTVTLVSLIIRIVISAQAASAMSMIASVLLETSTELADIAKISILRFVNTGPLLSVHSVIRLARTSPFMVSLTCCLAISSTTLQFASTLLLSDFGTTPTLTSRLTNEIQINYDSEISAELYRRDKLNKPFWTFEQNTLPTFAEHPNRTLSQFSETVVDTGVTIRGFLPITSEELRENLVRYDGYGMLLDMRVACVQPIIENAKVNVPVPEDSLSGIESYLSGHISPSRDIPLSHLPLSGYKSQFRCIIANNTDFGGFVPGLPGFIQSRKPSFSICPLSYENGLTSPLGNYNKVGAVHVILDNTDLNMTLVVPPDGINWTAHGDGLWTRLDSNTQSHSLRVTMCFDSRNPFNNTRRMTAQGFGHREEPRITSVNPMSNTFHTEEARRQLGATNQSATHQQRGILALTEDFENRDDRGFPISFFDDSMDPNLLDIGLELDLNRIFRGLRLSPTIIICDYCSSDDTVSQYHVDARLRAIFNDIITDTGNPALALQALYTIFTQTVYCGLLSYCNMARNSTITMVQDASVPVRRTGLVTVATLILFHLLLVGLSGISFALWTQNSLLNNAWQVIAQTSEIIKDATVGRATNITDKELRRLLRADGREDEIYVLSVVESGIQNTENDSSIKALVVRKSLVEVGEELLNLTSEERGSFESIHLE